jgi:hypothetical protein
MRARDRSMMTATSAVTTHATAKEAIAMPPPSFCTCCNGIPSMHVQ